jgi:hypothetical protein
LDLLIAVPLRAKSIANSELGYNSTAIFAISNHTDYKGQSLGTTTGCYEICWKTSSDR